MIPQRRYDPICNTHKNKYAINSNLCTTKFVQGVVVIYTNTPLLKLLKSIFTK